MIDLKPCPFCDARLQRIGKDFTHPRGKCILSGHHFKGGFIGQWNTRAHDVPVSQSPEAPAVACNPVGWQRKYKYEMAGPGSFDVWRECPQSEATGFQPRVPGYEYRPVFAHPSPSFEDGLKDGLRMAAALVREKQIVHVAGGMSLLEPRGEGNLSGLAYADAIEALTDNLW